MASQPRKPRTPRKPAAPKAPDNSLEVLFPEQHVSVGGRDLVVRELTFAEQMRYGHLMAPIAQTLTTIPSDQVEGVDGVNVIYDALASHAEALVELVAVSCGQPVEWVAELRPVEGENLLLTWWGVNQGFFLRRVQRARLMGLALALRTQPLGSESSPTSSRPATTAPTSPTTPADS